MADEADLIYRKDIIRLLGENGVVFRKELEKLPAANAIPIEWLEEYDDAFDNVLPISAALKAWRNR